MMVADTSRSLSLPWDISADTQQVGKTFPSSHLLMLSHILFSLFSTFFLSLLLPPTYLFALSCSTFPNSILCILFFRTFSLLPHSFSCLLPAPSFLFLRRSSLSFLFFSISSLRFCFLTFFSLDLTTFLLFPFQLFLLIIFFLCIFPVSVSYLWSPSFFPLFVLLGSFRYVVLLNSSPSFSSLASSL